MKQTALLAVHKEAGAVLVPFAGWEMPVSYAGTVGEVESVRTRAGLFDVSHMGELGMRGAGALAFVQRVTTNDAGRLSPGQAQYSLLLNEAGGVIDDIIVYCLGPDDYLIVVNAGCKDKDWQWLQEQARDAPGVALADESDRTALLAVQGPAAVAQVASLTGDDAVAKVPRFGWIAKSFEGIPLRLSRTGYTGEDGFEIFCPWDAAPRVWQALTAQGARPAGLGARDVLRLEAAYPLYGHELDPETGPWASGVGWAVKTGKGDFIGRDAALARHRDHLRRQLVGLRMDERAIPREEQTVFDQGGTSILGQVTSGTWSPTLKAGIALARLTHTAAEPGTAVLVDIRGRRAPARVVPLPFYRNGV